LLEMYNTCAIPTNGKNKRKVKTIALSIFLRFTIVTKIQLVCSRSLIEIILSLIKFK